MHKLLDFIISNKHWFLLLLLEVIALLMFMSDGLYRQGLRLYAHSYITGHVNEVMTEGYSYMDLRTKNERLLQEKARLEHELIALRRAVNDAQAEGRLPYFSMDSVALPGSYVTARIINVSAQVGDAYYMLNKGARDGIRPDMAVMSLAGVVGTVTDVSPSYAIVIPITNSKLKLSCSVLGKGYQGQLSSQGRGKPSILGGLPLHATILEGDTIVTSGYSYVFPEGIMVGTIEQSDKQGVQGADAAFGTYRIKLATDFDRLQYVYVWLSPAVTEAQALQESIERQ